MTYTKDTYYHKENFKVNDNEYLIGYTIDKIEGGHGGIKILMQEGLYLIIVNLYEYSDGTGGLQVDKTDTGTYTAVLITVI